VADLEAPGPYLDAPPEVIVADLLDALRVAAEAPDRFRAEAPDWFGDRVFGGVVVAQALAAADATVEPPLRAHSAHAYFLGALRPGPVELEVDRLRDGRTFSTRHVRSIQADRTALWQTVSFHADEPGDAYQLAMPVDVPDPDALEPSDDSPPPLEMRDIGPTERRVDGTFSSTRRCWVRPVAPLPDDPGAHLLVAGFLSDLTGTSFRPLNLGEWGTHTDASIDHAVWFHHEPRFDDWTYMDFHAVINHAGRSTVRGAVFDRAGRLLLTMAQELLIRPMVEVP
jgi:acyl-CoA thioesterase-2